ncbi:MAG: class I SAM-dependent methyltransferase [Chloroflexi bacterium]|nr:class I SAM-dependent methyltransferase [Chloroflexota bacterium]
MSEQAYIGKELEIFAKALRWKAYFKSEIDACIGKRVLEVGAGLGANTGILCDGSQTEWVCLEPDAELLGTIRSKIERGEFPRCCTARGGFVSDLPAEESFDTILYMDVLEHIEKDWLELENACKHLTIGGKLIVLSPAHNFLYSPFDKSIGHYRRYANKSISAITPADCRIVKLIQLDLLGIFTSLANRFFLRQPIPSEKQILFWDRNIVPISKFFDRFAGYRFGRSIICVWERVR